MTAQTTQPTISPEVATATASHPLARRASGLIGSVIDSSTSLLQKQSHDIVRFAMGSPAADAVPAAILAGVAEAGLRAGDRSEAHASELQPRGPLVCRPLLEKKKT